MGSFCFLIHSNSYDWLTVRFYVTIFIYFIISVKPFLNSSKNTSICMGMLFWVVMWWSVNTFSLNSVYRWLSEQVFTNIVKIGIIGSYPFLDLRVVDPLSVWHYISLFFYDGPLRFFFFFWWLWTLLYVCIVLVIWLIFFSLCL